MTSQAPEPAGGDGLLLIIATAVIVVVAGEAAFVAFPSMWLMPFAILGALLVTAGVIYAAMRTIENDSPAPSPRRSTETEPAPQPKAAPVLTHRTLTGH